VLRGWGAVVVGDCCRGINGLALDTSHVPADGTVSVTVTIIEQLVVRVIESNYRIFTSRIAKAGLLVYLC
jgi:hypothetical protein